MLHPAVTSIAVTANGNNTWLGEAPSGYWIGDYIDSGLLMMIGGIPWQVNILCISFYLYRYR